MNTVGEFVLRSVVIGTGATVILDSYALLLQRILGIAGLNFAMVGRWIGHFGNGRFVHASIVQAAPVRGEAVLGWSAHYVIGIVFAAILLAVWGVDWALRPTLLPALIVGVVSVAAPFCILQPGMGAGWFASKTPKPNVARLRSLAAHTVFGLGLYLAALIAAPLWRG